MGNGSSLVGREAKGKARNGSEFVDSPFRRFETPPAEQGKRKKDKGFLGPLRLPDGESFATEYSTGVQIDGVEIELPTLVPTLTEDEVARMVEDIIPNRKPIPEDILRKAIEHARKRMNAGKNPFFSSSEKAR